MNTNSNPAAPSTHNGNATGYVTVAQHILKGQSHYPTASGEFSWLLSAITLATKIISANVRRAGLLDITGYLEQENVQGEVQHKLDVISNDALVHALGSRGNVGIVASEEDDEPRVLQEVDSGGKYVVMFDPLDGSSNIDAGVAIGTIFTIFKNPPDSKSTTESVCQPGAQQIAAGYVLYGSSTILVLTTGHGVNMFTLDPAVGAYMLVREDIRMPTHAPQYSVNEAYRSTFPEPYQDYLFWAKGERHLEGHPAPPKQGFSLRYIGSLVADFHRILLKGGVFMYPPTHNNPDGKLRLMYEANPLAFVAEQAGGMATDGSMRIMDKQPTGVHERTSLVIGSRDNVNEIMQFVNPPKK